MNNTTGAISGTRNAYSSEAFKFTLIFDAICEAQS